MILHSAIVSYQRLELTKRVIESYLETVSVPHTLVVVDNGSDLETTSWLKAECWGVFDLILLDANFYPGHATNRGWDHAPKDATHLQRCDNDFEFLPGWCEWVKRAFESPKIGQVGLRTDEEELRAPWNVGGNCIIRREIWDQGFRWDERPWTELGGTTEDYYASQAVNAMGYKWTRVRRPCIRSLASGDLNDPYYIESYGARGILEWATERTEAMKRTMGIKEEA